MKTAAICLSLLAAAALAADVAATPPTTKGTRVTTSSLPAPTPVLKDAMSFFLAGDKRLASLKIVPAAGQAFASAMRVTTATQPANSWDIQLAARSAAPVAKDDVLLATFWARAAEGNEATASFIFEIAGPPYTKSADCAVSVGVQWKRFHVPFKSLGDFAAGGAGINFQLGFQPQTIEIGGVEVVNYGRNARLADLPRATVHYRGREADAPWRKAAADRIARHRMGDLKVEVVNAAGEPVAGAVVQIRMTRQAFAIGAAVAAAALLKEGPDGQKYRQFIESNCNRVVFENDLKWPQWEDKASRDRMMQARQWLAERHIEIRGHCLVWPAWRWLPKDLQGLAGSPDALRKRVADHVSEEVAAMNGSLVEWDVINEPYANHDLMDILGQDAMADWFRLAREADANVRLFVNDYSILSAGGTDKSHQDHYEKTIRFLQAAKAPIGGIGIQGHFDSRLTPPDRLIEVLDRFASLGLPIEVTEFDVNIDDEDVQAAYTRDFMTALYSHPAVSGILTWGFWEGRHWLPKAAMYRKDWTLKPNGQAWLDVVKSWQTQATVTTAADGAANAVRGHLGEYEIIAAAAGKTAATRATLTTAGATVRVVLK
jgi:GH35 family endo-1,4-beta-xylanase